MLGLTYEGSEGLLDDHHLYLSFLAAQQLDYIGEDAYAYAIQSTFYPLHQISNKTALDAVRCKMPVSFLLGYDQYIIRNALQLTLGYNIVNKQVKNDTKIGYDKIYHTYLEKHCRCFKREAMISALSDVLAENDIDANNNITSIAIDQSRYCYRVWTWSLEKIAIIKSSLKEDWKGWLAVIGLLALAIFLTIYQSR